MSPGLWQKLHLSMDFEQTSFGLCPILLQDKHCVVRFVVFVDTSFLNFCGLLAIAEELAGERQASVLA